MTYFSNVEPVRDCTGNICVRACVVPPLNYKPKDRSVLCSGASGSAFVMLNCGITEVFQAKNIKMPWVLRVSLCWHFVNCCTCTSHC
jgi:hypothetical protein